MKSTQNSVDILLSVGIMVRTDMKENVNRIQSWWLRKHNSYTQSVA